MKRLLLFLLLPLLLLLLPLSAIGQVTIQGGVLLGSSGGGGGTCTNCAQTNAANTFTLNNTFPSLSVTGGINGLHVYENTGLFNIGLGTSSTPTTASGIQNLGIGDGANQSLTTGYDMTAIGVAANGNATTASENTGIGTFACQNNVSGVGQTCVGALAGADSLGSYNVYIGNLANGNQVTGNNTVAIGSFSGCGTLCSSGVGTITSVANGVYIGFQTGASVNSVTNQILIGYNVQSANSNQMILGDSALTATTIYGLPTFPALAGAGSGCIGITNAGLTSTVACGSGGTPTFQVNGTNLISTSTINYVNGANVTITNPSAGNVNIAVSSLAFSAVGSGTSSGTLLLSGSLAATGGGTITATAMPYTGLTGTVTTWNQNTTGNAATATALAATPTLCSTGSAPTGILANGNATGCAAIGGGGGGGITIQTNGTNNSSQTAINFTNTATVLFTNPSGSAESATVPTATSGAVGVSNFDNTSIGITAGALHIISPGNNTLLGFNGSGTYTGFTLGTGLSFAGSVLNAAAGISGTLSTANCIAKQLTSTSVTCALATENGTAFTITDPGGLAVTGTIPGLVQLGAGSGTLSLNTNSYAELGPLTGGTSYAFQHPNTAGVGFEQWSALTTLNGIPVTQSTFVHLERLFGATGEWGFLTAPVVLAQGTALNASHFVNLSVTNINGGSCSTAPTFNVYSGTTAGIAVTGSTTQQAAGTTTSNTSETLAIAANGVYSVVMTGAGTCTGPNFAVYATVETP
jgi:hypothetical protein